MTAVGGTASVAGSGGATGGAGAGGNAGTAGSSAAGAAGAGGSPTVVCNGADQVAPGSTRTFGNVTASYVASATDCLVVTVEGDALMAPLPYVRLPGSPTVQLSATSGALTGRADVRIAALSGASATTEVIRVAEGAAAAGIAETLVGTEMRFSATRSGIYLVASYMLPPLPCSPGLTRAGGTFDGTSISQLEGVARLTSGLTITGATPASLAALACLVEVDGSVSIHDTSTLTSFVGLEQLSRVTGNLDIYSNAALASIDQLGGLSVLGGRLYVYNNPNLLSAAGFVRLNEVGNYIDVESNARLLDLKLPVLGELNSSFTFASNGGSATMPTTFDLSGLEIVHGTVSIHDNKTWQLGSGLENLRIVEGNLDLYSNTQLERLDQLTRLETLTGRIYVYNNPALLSADGFMALTTLGNYIDVESNARLVSFKAPRLVELNSSLNYLNNGGSATTPAAFDLSALRVVHNTVTVHDNKTWQLGGGLTSLEIVEGNFDVYSNTELDDLDQLGRLRTITGRLYVYNNPALLSANGFTGLTTLGNYLDVESNARLLSFRAPLLTELNSSLNFLNNGGSANTPTTFDLSGLRVVHNTVTIHDNKTWQLEGGLRNLEIVEGNFDVYSNPQLDDVDQLTALRTITGRLYLYNNPALVTADGFTALSALGNYLDVESNARLLSFKAPELTELNSSLTFLNNGNSATSTTSFDLGKLRIVRNTVTIHDNKTWQLGRGLEKLEIVEGNFDVYSNTQLTDLDDLTYLDTITGRLYIYNNPALVTADGFTALRTLGNYLDVESNARLLSFKAPQLAELSSSLNFLHNGSSATATTSFDLSDLEVVRSTVTIHDNKTWQLGGGLSSLRVVEGNLDIYSNTQLVELDGTASLATVTGRIYVYNNAALNDLALPALVTLGSSLTVQSNRFLPTCDAVALRTQLANLGWTGTSVISANLADGCGS
jgi:hypothetical protein